MRFSPLVDRVAGKGAAAWAVHFEAQQRAAAGRDVILLTVGDPDQHPPEPVIEATVASLRRHRTGYSGIVRPSTAPLCGALRVRIKLGLPSTSVRIPDAIPALSSS
jgi:arginine:pyruvate transaminase